MLGYERLRVAQRLAKDRGRLLGAEASGVRSQLTDDAIVDRMLLDARARLEQTQARAAAAHARHAAAAAAMQELVPLWDGMQREREQARAALAELRVAESESAAYLRDVERVTRELADITTADEELGRLAEELTPLALLTEELEGLDQLAHADARRLALLESERELDDEVRQLRERRAKIEDAPAREEEVTIELESMRGILEFNEGELEAKRTEWVRDRQEAETKRAALRAQYTETKRAADVLVEAGEDGTCPICERPLHDHFRSVLDHFEEQMQTLVSDGKYFSLRIEQLEALPPEIRELDERRRTTFDEVSRLGRELATVQVEVKERTSVLRDLNVREQRLAQVRAERESIASGYDAARHAAARLELERLRTIDSPRATRLAERVVRRPSLEADLERAAAGLAQAHARVAALQRHSRRAGVLRGGSPRALRLRHEAAAAELPQQ